MSAEDFGRARPKDGELTPWVLCVTTRYVVGGFRVETPMAMSTFHPLHFDETLSMNEVVKRLSAGSNAFGLSVDAQSFEPAKLPCFEHELIFFTANPFCDNLMIFESFADAMNWIGSRSNHFAARFAEHLGVDFHPAIKGRPGERFQVNDGLAEVFREKNARRQRQVIENESALISRAHSLGGARL